MFGDGRVREIQIARYVRARRSTRRRPQRQRAAVSGDDFYRINPVAASPSIITGRNVTMEMVRLSGRPHGQWVGPAGFGWPRRGAKPKMGQAATHSSTHSRTFKGGQESEKYKVLGAHPPPQPHRCQNVFEDRAQRLTLRCRMRSLTRTGCCAYFWLPKMDRLSFRVVVSFPSSRGERLAKLASRHGGSP
jgi:hypothetical protein